MLLEEHNVPHVIGVSAHHKPLTKRLVAVGPVGVFGVLLPAIAAIRDLLGEDIFPGWDIQLQECLRDLLEGMWLVAKGVAVSDKQVFFVGSLDKRRDKQREKTKQKTNTPNHKAPQVGVCNALHASFVMRRW